MAERFGTAFSGSVAGTTRSSKRYTDSRTGRLADRTLGFGAPRRRKNAFITVLLPANPDARRLTAAAGTIKVPRWVRNQGVIRTVKRRRHRCRRGTTGRRR